MKTTEPIRDRNKVRQLAEYFLNKNQIRNYILIIISIYTGLRISDILLLRWDDVYDFQNRHVKDTLSLTEKKTRKGKIIALNKDVILALKRATGAGLALQGRFIIENAQTRLAISRIQAYRIIKAAAREVEIELPVSCHSLRKTFGYHSWKMGVSPVIIMEIYNHSSLEVTKRYLGISQDDRNGVYTKLSFLGK